MSVREGDVLWRPSEQRKARSNLVSFMSWLTNERGLAFADYQALWRWSVTQPEDFWKSIWDYYKIISHTAFDQVLTNRHMPGAQWFVGSTLNYAEHALRRRDSHQAIVYWREDGTSQTLTYAELYKQVCAAAEGLRRLGVQAGDRVAAFACNTPETVVAFLATVSLGAIWSSCSVEFGLGSVLDRFKQISPKVLFVHTANSYGGKIHERSETIANIQKNLPSLVATVAMPSVESAKKAELHTFSWDSFLCPTSSLRFTAVPFAHPLWILYSSGTTGLPKPIVQSHGGILLEHFKALSLHCDLHADDRFFWFTTTGWMMWNFLVSGLLLGCTIILYDGSPAYPDLNVLWRMAEKTKLNYFGTSAPFLMACRRDHIEPRAVGNLENLLSIGSTGAPLPVEGFAWVYDHIKKDVLLGSVSGGTDVCTAFVLSAPLLPVHAGEIQVRGLGCDVRAYNSDGQEQVGEVGELVVAQPMPSMPIGFWNDPQGERFFDAYFSTFPGVWRHGDWIKMTTRGSCVIYGRSDATLNRGGVRMGTSEFYSVVEALNEVVDSLVVDTGALGHEDKLLLFVVLRDGLRLTTELEQSIRHQLKQQLSPRHIPDVIVAVREIPRTLNGKKMEVPIKKILTGTNVEQAINRDTVANPVALNEFMEFARQSLAV